jgi:hypothetical protein
MTDKFLKTTCIFIVILTVLPSCLKDKDINEISVDLKSEFEQAAKLHNEAMDYIIHSIQNKKNEDNEYYFQEVEKLSREFIKSNINTFEVNTDPLKFMIEESKKIKIFKNSSQLKSTYAEDDYLQYIIDNSKDALTQDQIDLLNKINDVIRPDFSIDQIINELNYIKDIECQKLKAGERNVIYAATTTGIESVKYWHENSHKWIEVFMNDVVAINLKSAEGWFKWDSVGKSDIAGAIGGAIGGAMVGAVASGVGAGPGAIAGFVGGGIGSSATDAVNQCLKKLF